MEIFVRAYQDSDGDGHGDLRGLISRLDYLRDLGVRGLWLMPIQPSADRDHGYATTEFRAVDPQYGTLADFDELLRQAHARGIGVITDYVVNHASHRHPLFQQALSGPDNRFRDWFVWSEAAPQGWDIWGKNPWYHAASQPWAWSGEPKDLPAAPPGARGFYFGTFGPHMPDFNLRRDEVWRYHEDSLRFWLNRGLDGFRLDAVPHLVENSAQAWNDQPESRALTKRLQELVKGYRHRWTVCEATAEPRVWGRPEVCGAAFAFGHVHHYVEAARGKTESVQALLSYWRDAPAGMATFVSNHDIFAGRRLWDQLGGDVRRYKLAAAGYLLQPGTPFIYYGEEIGLPGLHAQGLQGDAPIRGPMSWSDDEPGAGFTRGQPFRPLAPGRAAHNVRTQAADPGSILHFYKAMLKLRNTLPSIRRGSFEAARADGLVASWQRRWAGEHTVVAINYGEAPAPAMLEGLPPGARLQAHHGATSLVADDGGRLRVSLPALSVAVWEVK
jgi:glycosidase